MWGIGAWSRIGCSTSNRPIADDRTQGRYPAAEIKGELEAVTPESSLAVPLVRAGSARFPALVDGLAFLRIIH